MKVLIIIAILWPVLMVAAFAFIGAVIMIKREEGTVSPVKLYHVYRRQMCAMLKNRP